MSIHARPILWYTEGVEDRGEVFLFALKGCPGGTPADPQQIGKRHQSSLLESGMAPISEAKREYNRRYYREHREAIRAQQREYNRKHRAELTAYRREYDKRNAEKVYLRRKAYYERNAEEISQKNKLWREQHADQIRDRSHRYSRENAEVLREKARRWRADNPERSKKMCRSYYKRHASELCAYARRRRRSTTIKRFDYYGRRRMREQRLPYTLTNEEWQGALDYFGGCCAVCGRPPGLWHTIAADHWIPVSDPRPDNPGTVVTNIVPLCHAKAGANFADCCNNSKYENDPREWLIQKFGSRRAAKIEARIQAYFDSVRQEE